MSFEQNREVICRIFDLLQTIDDALEHMEVQLEELRMEESAVLFKDISEAISNIANHDLLLLIYNTGEYSLDTIINLRKAITMIINAYEQNNLAAIQCGLINRLIPAFSAWKKELKDILVPAILC